MHSSSSRIEKLCTQGINNHVECLHILTRGLNEIG